MIDYRLIEKIEQNGYTNKDGEHIYGTAALLHFLSLRMRNLNQLHIAHGKDYVEKYLSCQI